MLCIFQKWSRNRSGNYLSNKMSSPLTARRLNSFSFDSKLILYMLKLHLVSRTYFGQVSRSNFILKGTTPLLFCPVKVTVRFPNNLERSLTDWTEKEKIWLNITHFPWPQDESCQRFSVTFGRKLPLVGLASYPSSGNTWIRKQKPKYFRHCCLWSTRVV